ncbi:MAG: GyrI-like domain-containing protein [Clostridia bacterium]|nr:GyrI-like domain-containing protein [Clostridia bacterium]
MAFDFKKEYKEFYLPPRKPEIVTVPPMQYVAVEGGGNPNVPGGLFQQAIQVLYSLAYTVKMSKMSDHRMAGYFDFVVPPLEGFWWQAGVERVDFTRKDAFQWIAAIRLPDFVTEAEFRWAKNEAETKKRLDCSAARLLSIEEGLCVQMLHVGSYDDEPASVQKMERFVEENGCRMDANGPRRHHEIYLSDARKVPPDKRRTVLRLPVFRLS